MIYLKTSRCVIEKNDHKSDENDKTLNLRQIWDICPIKLKFSGYAIFNAYGKEFAIHYAGFSWVHVHP